MSAYINLSKYTLIEWNIVTRPYYSINFFVCDIVFFIFMLNVIFMPDLFSLRIFKIIVNNLHRKYIHLLPS